MLALHRVQQKNTGQMVTKRGLGPLAWLCVPGTGYLGLDWATVTITPTSRHVSVRVNTDEKVLSCIMLMVVWSRVWHIYLCICICLNISLLKAWWLKSWLLSTCQSVAGQDTSFSTGPSYFYLLSNISLFMQLDYGREKQIHQKLVIFRSLLHQFTCF